MFEKHKKQGINIFLFFLHDELISIIYVSNKVSAEENYLHLPVCEELCLFF